MADGYVLETELDTYKNEVTNNYALKSEIPTTADQVGARASTWLPSHNDMRTMILGTWDGSTVPNNMPAGITYVAAGDLSTGHGFPIGYCTIMALRDSTSRLFQILITKETGKMYIRSAIDGTTWGEWQSYLPTLSIYPVGAIYISTVSTSPASLFGGTWEQLKDRFLLGAGSTYSNGSTGGSATVTLNNTQIPNHTHKIARGDKASGTTEFPANSISILNSSCQHMSAAGNRYTSLTGTNATNGGGSHNNMPPYLTVYMWKRVS